MKNNLDTVDNLLEKVLTRINQNSDKAKYGLELAERLLDKESLERGYLPNDPINPLLEKYNKINNYWTFIKSNHS